MSFLKTFLSFALLCLFIGSIEAQLSHPILFRVNSPAGIAGDYLHSNATDWGPTSISSITGDLAWIDNGTDSLGCTAAVNDLTGKIAFIRRGDCAFSDKALNAQQAGAIGCVIVNNVPGSDLVNMSGSASGASVTIPVIFVSFDTGLLLQQEIDNGNITNVSFVIPSITKGITSYAKQLPLQHVRTLDAFQVNLFNESVTALSNVDVHALIEDPTGVVTTLSETVSVVPSNLDTTIEFSGTYLPTNVGTYNVRFVSSISPLDTIMQDFIVNSDSLLTLDNGNLSTGGGVGLTDADFVSGGHILGMGAVYKTGINTTPSSIQRVAASAAFSLSNANAYLGESFSVLLYQAPQGGFVGNEQDFSTFTLLGAGVYTISAADTLTPNTLLNVPLVDFMSSTQAAPILADNEEYMLMIKYEGNGSVVESPRFGYTHNEEYMDIADIVFSDRLYMGGFSNKYGVVIRLHINDQNISNTSARELPETALKVYPNPTVDFINVELDLLEEAKEIAIHVLSIDGKVIREVKDNSVASNTYEIDLQALPAGIYTVLVQCDNAFSTRKLIIK